MKKYNLLFDMTAIYNGCNNGAARTGIYFCAFNIFNELIKHKDKINLYLYCQSDQIFLISKFLDFYFPNEKFFIINNSFTLLYKKKYREIKQKRELAKKNNNIFMKIFFQVYAILLAILIKSIDSISFFYFVTRKNFDIYFSPFHKIPKEIELNKNITKCIILHDVVAIVLPELTPESNPKSDFMKFFNSLNKKNYYLANSEYTKYDFLKYSKNIDNNKIKTVLHACGDHFKPQNNTNIELIKKKYNIPLDKKYIFSLCTLEPRKNLIRVVRTFIEFINKNKIDDFVFVMGGGHLNIFISQLEKEIDNLKEFKNKIIRIGYVEDDDLPSLYSGAQWFIYTSQYEGFGVPALEAMSCGCPVIVSNNTSLPEVVGDAGILVDYDSDEQHIEAYKKYYFDEAFRKENIKKGLERASKFSWHKSTAEIAKLLIEFRENDLKNMGKSKCKQ